jgi:hypothetical protein
MEDPETLQQESTPAGEGCLISWTESLLLDLVIILIALFWSWNILLLSEQFAQKIIP